MNGNDTQDTMTIAPEQQITNVVNSMIGYMDVAPFHGRVDLMRHSLYQLKEMWVKYQSGELEPLSEEVPF